MWGLVHIWALVLKEMELVVIFMLTSLKHGKWLLNRCQKLKKSHHADSAESNGDDQKNKVVKLRLSTIDGIFFSK